MNTKRTMGAVAAVLFGITSLAYGEGCLKGAAVGGTAGHFVGNGHATAGAAGGCAVGHHEAAKKDKKEAAANAQEKHGSAQQSSQQ
ncbi:hypothetical protein [Paraburkholderia sp.]|uniref:hypothetical protein n=1 Tax=Paraburkholderia sp. TaxID=1926495 RepID=UPI003C783C5A